MKDIMVIHAVFTCDGQTYLYSPGSKPTGVKTGEPYCTNPNLGLEVLATLDAAHLYPLEETYEIEVRRAEYIVQP